MISRVTGISGVSIIGGKPDRYANEMIHEWGLVPAGAATRKKLHMGAIDPDGNLFVEYDQTDFHLFRGTETVMTLTKGDVMSTKNNYGKFVTPLKCLCPGFSELTIHLGSFSS